MATGTKSESNTSGAIIGVGIVVVALGVWGAIFGGDRFAPEEEPSNQERVLATFEVRWGEIIDTGETFEDTDRPINRLECHDRELEIVIIVDGDEQVMNQWNSDASDEEPCTFRHNRTVAQGAQLRMIVREVEVYGWKMATIHIDGHLAVPNGMATSPDDRPVEVWAVAI